MGQFCTLQKENCLRQYLLCELGSDETNLPESDAAECCSNGSTPHNEISDHMRKQKQTRNNKQPLSEINDSISEELEKRLKEE